MVIAQEHAAGPVVGQTTPRTACTVWCRSSAQWQHSSPAPAPAVTRRTSWEGITRWTGHRRLKHTRDRRGHEAVSSPRGGGGGKNIITMEHAFRRRGQRVTRVSCHSDGETCNRSKIPPFHAYKLDSPRTPFSRVQNVHSPSGSPTHPRAPSPSVGHPPSPWVVLPSKLLSQRGAR